ncbi:MAG: PAS domain S-box protein [Candidatus Tectomicrobia bacterium]|nr:PAS domain S-box protein [Candidatus Tectomicrobia bacterium]
MMGLKKLNIQWIIWIAAAFVIMILLLISHYLYITTEREMAEQFNMQQLILARQAAKGIEQYLKNVFMTLKFAAEIHDWEHIQRQEAMWLMDQLYTKLKGGVTEIVHVDHEGIVKNVYPEYRLEYVFWRENYKDRPDFQVCKMNGYGCISELPLSGDSMARVSISAPIYAQVPSGSEREKERFRGVLAATIDTTVINQLYIAPIRSGGTGYAWVIDQHGKFLIEPKAPEVMGKDIGHVIPLTEFPQLHALITQMMKGETGTDWHYSVGYGTTKRKMKKLTAFAPIHIGALQTWSIGVSAPFSEVTSLMRKSFSNVLILILFGLVTVLTGATFASRIEKERIQAEEKTRWSEQLLESKNRLQALFDGITDGISIIDREHKILMVNHGLLSFCGKGEKDLLGRTCCHEFLGVGSEYIMNCPVARAFSTGMPTCSEQVRIDREGKKVEMEVYAFPLKDQRGEAVQVIEYAKDITERKQLQRQIIQTERLATIGKMSAQVAHEIRNPLSSISLNADLLEEELDGYKGVDTEEAKCLLQSIKSEIDLLTEVTQDYLKFARLPRIKLERESLNEILQNLLMLLREEMLDGRIRLTSELDSSLPEIMADENQLRQAFLNVLKNAIQAMPDGGELNVRTKREHGYAIAQISDAGVGIKREDLEKIFEPFYSTKENGTGLGLPFTQMVVREHGGYIFCSSTPGEGTIFSISLPIP